MNLFYQLISDDAGKRLKYERRAWGMSRRRLAYLTKTDPETIEYIERGYVCMMDYDMLNKFCRTLDISPFCFFRRRLTDDEFMSII